jgi:hypothetical protein
MSGFEPQTFWISVISIKLNNRSLSKAMGKNLRNKNPEFSIQNNPIYFIRKFQENYK